MANEENSTPVDPEARDRRVQALTFAMQLRRDRPCGVDNLIEDAGKIAAFIGGTETPQATE